MNNKLVNHNYIILSDHWRKNLMGTKIFQSKQTGYARLVVDLKAILEVEKIWGQRVLNSIKLQITWKVGERIFQELQNQADNSAPLMPLI